MSKNIHIPLGVNAARWVALIALMMITSANSAATIEKNSVYDHDVAGLLNALPVNGQVLIREIWPDIRFRDVCLVSNEDGLHLVKKGCKAPFTSLVLSNGAGMCVLIDLTSVTSRILSGSLETECETMRPELAITKINRYGQHHIVFSEPTQR